MSLSSARKVKRGDKRVYTYIPLVHASLSHLKGTDSNNCKLGSQSSAGKLLDGILHYSLSKEQRLLPTRSLADRIYTRSDLTPHHLIVPFLA